MKRFVTILVVFLTIPVSYSFAGNTIDLSGQWQIALDREDVGMKQQWFATSLPGDDKVRLPGSLQEQGYGSKPSAQTVWTAGIGSELLKQKRFEPYVQVEDYKSPFWLTPDRHYVGPAWYQKTVSIQPALSGKRITLYLERPHWQTTVWVDGQQAGTQDALGTPHEYDLTDLLTVGKHTLTIRVDNSMIIPVGNNAHSVSDQTQSNWNGIIGDIELRTTNPIWFDDVQVYPNVSKKQIRVKAYLGSRTTKGGKGTLTVSTHSRNSDKTLSPKSADMQVSWGPEQGFIEFVYDMGEDCLLWDEFHPALYDLTLRLQIKNQIVEKQVSFGMRQLDIEGTQFTINGKPIFLRGTLECAIFPKTGYPPMDIDSWKEILTVARSHGLNHLRFHSWCPPKSAFEAADQMGFYFQVEVSCWTEFGNKSPVDTWIYEEGDRMLAEYGNHPSFILMVPSNEPGGKNRNVFLGNLVKYWARKDPRRRFAAGSGWPAIPENQYHVLYKHRLQQYPGLRLTDRPQTATDYRDYITKMGIPVVSHEIGQWCAYPDFEEIPKYTGSLKARYLEIAQDMLQKAGMANLGKAFHITSGKFQAILYKQEIESALRTPGMPGFQLLDLHDFPGQGYAPVGVLDPFWESKGYITSEEYSRFCGPIVPLARMEKLVFTNDETFTADIDISNYGPGEETIDAKWTIRNFDGNVQASGKLPALKAPAGSLSTLGTVEFDLGQIDSAEQLNLEIAFEDSTIANDWDFWVYPTVTEKMNLKKIILTDSQEEALAMLNAGKKVLLMPKPLMLKSETLGTFKPIFWNRVTFSSQPEHTLGIYCDPSHPALKRFPTESHTNWQWHDLLMHCKPVVLDDLPESIEPIVRMIDDWFVCRKLGLVFEASMGKGKLILCSVDLFGDLEDRPASRQFRHSLLEYMQSKSFDPKVRLTKEQFQSLFRKPTLFESLEADVLFTDSHQPGYEGSKVIDNNPASMWHTQWDPKKPGHPHEIQIDLKKEISIAGFTVLPRQDGKQNGWIAEYEFSVSNDKLNWGTPTAKGRFSDTMEKKEIRFE